jgi:hypothetical protein
VILRELDRANLEPRALGRSDYPTELPLREVLLLAKHCSGGVILGFEQFQSERGVSKRGTPDEKAMRSAIPFPTPWNHLEAGILFGLQLPLLVFAEDGITGGVFDRGVTDVFIHRMPLPTMSTSAKKALSRYSRNGRPVFAVTTTSSMGGPASNNGMQRTALRAAADAGR